MASLVFSVAGAAVGSLFGPVGAIAGRIAGAIAGNLIDQSLFGDRQQLQGPRRADLDVTTSTEGAPIPRVYGRGRVSGQLIWATRLLEVVSEDSQKTSAKSLGGPSVTTKTYSYFANFAIALAEGEVAHVARIWADGKLLDLNRVTWRFHRGTEDQEADPLIVAKEGAADALAYRGIAYVVFEKLALEAFGNRIPQLSFEVVRPVGELESMLRAVTLIPGTTEFGYATKKVARLLGPGKSEPENRHILHAATDVVASLDELQALCPRLERIALVVSWFGTDLRAGSCDLKPGVDSAHKPVTGAGWSVSGVSRAGAHPVSLSGGRANFGGTPSDGSVVALIREIKARGLHVTLYPFIMLDIPPDNALPDPRTGMAPQPAFPWRGHITCDPAPGVAGSLDGTTAAAAQVAAFFGNAQPHHFGVAGDAVTYAGPTEWSLRRMVLHYAKLATVAGGVDAFLIGSELRSLTRVRGLAASYPAVDQLVDLATGVRGILGDDTKITYAADWTEYGAHVVDDTADEVRFPLDPLWASSAIDAIGIDYYPPLSDWRDGDSHADRALTSSPYDAQYLAQNVARGEAYDWYYPDDSARAAQNRQPITDGSFGKPWMFRAKDVWNWWAQPHHERVAGVELTTATAWTPASKPIWLTEFGCPAVDKGANQPSVFPDTKSSDGGVPHFSSGARDDFIQRRTLEALLKTFDPAFGATPAHNPISPIYGDRMIDASRLYAWTWDARPFPVFPAALDVWSDGSNWETGHWLNGRLGAAPLDGLVGKILADADISADGASGLCGSVDGYLIDRSMSPRAAIDPLARAYTFDGVEDGAAVRFRQRGEPPFVSLSADLLVRFDDNTEARLVRAQESELPREIALGYTDTGADYRRSAVTSRRLAAGSARVAQADVAIATSDAEAQRRADIWLQDVWSSRELAEFRLPPSQLVLTPGDVVSVELSGRNRLLEIRDIVDGADRLIKARSIFPPALDARLGTATWRVPEVPIGGGPPHVVLLDLPQLGDEAPVVLQRAGVFAQPWPNAIAVWRSIDGATFEPIGVAGAPTVIGETVDPLTPGMPWRWDRTSKFRVVLLGGALASVTEAQVLNGANAAAIRHSDGDWEVFQFATATLVSEGTYELANLLRGQLGTEWLSGNTVPSGATFVLIDHRLTDIARGTDAAGRSATLRFVATDLDHGDEQAMSLISQPAMTALRPFCPVHVRARRDDAGVRLSWIRRTRFGGDSWEAAEVPLGEESERYDIEILNGGSVVRTISAATPTALYAQADELGDFGGAQNAIAVKIYQLSTVAGRGKPTIATPAVVS